MKISVRSTTQRQHRSVLRRECFLVKSTHTAFHLGDIAMRRRRMAAIIHKRLRNKTDLELSRDSITKIPVLADFHSRIESADRIERFTRDKDGSRTRYAGSFPEKQVIRDAIFSTFQLQFDRISSFVIKKPEPAVNEANAVFIKQCDLLLKALRLHRVVRIHESDGITLRFSRAFVSRRTHAGICLINIFHVVAESTHHLFRLVIRTIIDNDDLRRTVRLPEAQEIPLYVKDRFGDFYRDLFSQQVKRENERGVFLEYAWDMNWCDPCAANPLSADELRSLGVFWQAKHVFLTRLHVRYDATHFPEDLIFQETSDRANFQVRYILKHPWTGPDDCAAATAYRQQLRERYEREAQTLATLTGWNIGEIRKAMNLGVRPVNDQKKWYERLWSD